jgi:tetratricopeptide (TPR) repeat protein
MQELHVRRLCEEIRLDVLDEPAVAAYLSSRFPDHRLPGALAHLIHERTGGSPLFMNHVVDDLVRQGSVVHTDNRWQLGSVIEEIGPSVPESLRHMIDLQLHRLTPDEQRLLEAASVAGAEFSALEVATALDTSAAQVEAWSESLAGRHQFLRAAGMGEGPDGAVTSRYGFVHSLYRRAIEARLSASHRTRLHQRIGEYKETVQGSHAGTIAPELAAHFEQARDLKRAILYLTLAAENAVQRSANRAAVGYLSRAIALTQVGPKERLGTQMALLERLGTVRRVMGDMKGTANDFATLATVARRSEQVDRQADALIQQTPALGWIDREQSRRVAEQAVALSQGSTDRGLRARARGELAFGQLLAHGWRDEDAQACATALEAVRQSGSRTSLILHVGRSAYLHCHRSDYQAAIDAAAEGLQLALELGDAYHYMSCQFHRGWALLHRGDLGEAMVVLVDGLQMAERNGNRAWARVFRFAMAWVHEQAFDFEGARTLCEHELEQAREPLLGQFLGLIVLGTAYLGLGKHDHALTAFSEVTMRLDEGHILMDWILRMPLQRGLSEYWLARGDPERARHEADLLSELAARPPERTYLALGRQLLADIALLEDNPAQAEAELARGLAVLEGADAPLAEWRVHDSAANIHTRRKHATQAHRHRVRSAVILTRLADSLHDWPELRRSLLAAPRVQAALG